MFSSKDIFLGKGGATGYQISRSVRLRSSASAYFNRTLSTPTSNTTWTLSCWLKRGALSNGGIFAESTGYAGIYFASDKIRVMDNAGSVALETTAVYRDPSAWAHLVVRSNGTNIKAYWNSVEVGSYTGTITLLNAATSHFIGRYSSNYFDGYLTEINFIDGQALTPSSFGATNTTTGVWGPAKYTGTYGTNGFYLNFSDNSAATAAAIGKDLSGNGNNWTPNNISVTAGATYDSMVDTPTPYGSDSGVGGEVRGNYCTLNPISNPNSPLYTVSNGNLTYSCSSSAGNAGRMSIAGTVVLGTAKWYWECTPTDTNGGFGIAYFKDQAFDVNSSGSGSGSYVLGFSGGAANLNAGTLTYTGSAFSYVANDVIGLAYDGTANSLAFYKNGSLIGTYTGINAASWLPAMLVNTGGASTNFSINFGQRAFSYTAPTGFKALNTQNLSTPTIAAGNAYMDVLLWTGAGQTGTASITGLNFQPDFVWEKARTRADSHLLYDVIRGASTSSASKALSSNLTIAEGSQNDNTTFGYLSSFNSNGFSYFGGSSAEYFSFNGATYVAWNWKANGAGSSNTNGSITSTVSVNTTAGFSVVTYTGTGANATVGHGLGVAPSMVIVKQRSGVNDWPVYHVGQAATPQNGLVYLNATNAYASAANVWNSTAPTSSVFSVGTNGAVNTNTATYVAYCFAPIAGYSAFGSYTGNGAADGTFVYTGFRPRYLMIKRTDNVGSWWMIDTSRSPYNVSVQYLFADATATEGSDNAIDILSNGFKLRVATYQPNTSGGTFIYAAFAENPFKYALAR